MSVIDENVKPLNIVGQDEDKVDHRYVAILAGGHGTRLFPLSYDERPKQFVSVNGEGTLIQNTVERFKAVGIKATHIIIITTDDNQTELAHSQVDDLGILSQNVYQINPHYGYAGAMVKAAQFISEIDKQAVIVNSPSDQLIVLNEDFRDTIRLAIKTASHGAPTIIGVKINNLVTFKGCGHAIYDPEENTLCRVVKGFVEKPDDDKKADEMMRADNSACNTGINVWRADTLFQAMEGIDIETNEIGTAQFMDLLRDFNLRVAVGHFKWYDCGTLDSLYEVNKAKATEDHHNIWIGEATGIGCLNSYFYAEKGHRIRAYNVDEGVVVIANFIKGKPVLVICKRSDSQKVRFVAEDYRKHRDILDDDFGFSSRNNHVVWTDAYDECVIGFIGVEGYEVVAMKNTAPGIKNDWIISKPPRAKK